MDKAAGITAGDIVNTHSEQSIQEILRQYGEESHARTIARTIVESRPLQTTTELADVIQKRLGRRGKTHPATRTFQALRIAVNDELGQLSRTLPMLICLLSTGGRLAIISFHSLEDRLVKNFLREESSSGYEARLDLLTKPILGKTTDALNSRARSAVLRAAQRK
jgi:16S rRNA (cytosine1402-N4)-methyltransferase